MEKMQITYLVFPIFLIVAVGAYFIIPLILENDRLYKKLKSDREQFTNQKQSNDDKN